MDAVPTKVDLESLEIFGALSGFRRFENCRQAVYEILFLQIGPTGARFIVDLEEVNLIRIRRYPQGPEAGPHRLGSGEIGDQDDTSRFAQGLDESVQLLDAL